MPEERRPLPCQRCGSLVHAGDKFCGACGARISLDVQDAAPAQEIPTQVLSLPSVPTRRGNQTLILGVIGALLVLSLVGAGAFAALSLDDQRERSGGAQEQPANDNGNPPARAGDAGNIESALVPPDAPPDPAFDLLLPTLKEWTDAPIMLPAKLPNEFKNVAVDESRSGDRYGIVFLYTSPERILQQWARADAVGTLMATPTSEQAENEYFKATSIETVELPDGTEATFSHMEPVGRPGAYSPYWKGEFEKDGYTYTLSTFSDEIDEGAVQQALSTMVLVRGGTGETAEGSAEATEPTISTNLGSEEIEAEAEGAAREYYRAAGVEDWGYTYEHLDSDTQGLFTREEWFLKNQWFADNGFVVYNIESAERLGTSSGVVVEVTLRLTYEDGSSTTRKTYFVLEDGEWRHAFGQEEDDLFMPEASYEEFVAAQQ
jgi:hypothetical protein